MPQPEGRRTVNLRDLLPDDVIEKLVPIMNRIGQRKTDMMKGKDEILAVLLPFEAELEAKGVVVKYLMYLLLNLAVNGPGGDIHDAAFN